MQGERHANDNVSAHVARAVWGLLLIWTGAALLARWGWRVGLLGAGAILLGAQAVRRYLRVKIGAFGLVAGALLVVCGVWNDSELAVELLWAGAEIALIAWIRSRCLTSGTPRRTPT